ncbi:MAG: hypothetical protein P8188_11410, partial [Gemmatimonadota bacterium]
MTLAPAQRIGLRSLGLTLTAALLLGPTGSSAQDGDWDPQAILAAQEWVRPPASVAEAVLAPRYLNAELTEASPGGDW